MTDSGSGKPEDGSPLLPAEGRHQPIDAISAPLSVIEAAVNAVPAVRYALGLAGIAAAASLISSFVGTGVNAVATMGLMFVGMIVLYLFAALTTQGDKKQPVELPAKVLLWVVTMCVSVLAVSLTTAVTFAVPKNLASLLNVDYSTVEAINDYLIIDEPKTKFGYIYLGRRDGNKWANDKYAYGRIINSDEIPLNGDIFKIVQGVHLRKAVPDEKTPLVMTADLGTIKLGTSVRIKTVTKLDPDGFYWASVDILNPNP